MNLWYAAHIVMYVKRKGRAGAKVPIWENIVLLRAGSEEEAFEALRRNKLAFSPARDPGD